MIVERNIDMRIVRLATSVTVVLQSQGVATAITVEEETGGVSCLKLYLGKFEEL